MTRTSRRSFLLATLAVAACSTPSPPAPVPVAAPMTPSAASPADTAFVVSTFQSGLFALQASEIAARKASRPGIREFAQSVVDTQTQAHGQLAGLAQSRAITLPDALTPAQAKIIGALEKTPDGARFRRTYFAELVKSHLAAARQADAYGSTSTDPELKAFAVAQSEQLRAQVATARQLSRQRRAS